MKYDFDQVIDRRGTHSVKWEAGALLVQFGLTERFDEDTIPLWVADMDFWWSISKPACSSARTSCRGVIVGRRGIKRAPRPHSVARHTAQWRTRQGSALRA